MAKADAAQIWEDVFAVKTEEMGDRHLAELARLERQYGMRLPSVTNHLHERFVKPLVVNNMVALLAPACTEARERPVIPKNVALPRSSFAALQDNIEDYLQTTSGSGLEVPPWLRTLEEELNRIQRVDDRQAMSDAEGEVSLPESSLNLREMRQQLRQWREPLAPRKKK